MGSVGFPGFGWACELQMTDLSAENLPLPKDFHSSLWKKVMCIGFAAAAGKSSSDVDDITCHCRIFYWHPSSEFYTY